MSKRVDLNNVAARKPEDEGEYSDIDMRFLRAGAGHFSRKDGTPYPPK
jgi:uncharacterized cupin superfamily protein